MNQSTIEVLRKIRYSESNYLKLLRNVLEYGARKEDRTGTGTISLFGVQARYNLQEGYPLLTTKEMNLNKVLGEYLAFIHGETNANVISDKYGFKIWKLWADENGDLGPVYGKQWRQWETHEPLEEYPGIYRKRTVDQLQWVIDEIKRNPNSRRLMVNAWNTGELHKMALPPCHFAFQFNVTDGKLNCMVYQRSGDMFLGVPFNIAGYAAITMMVAQLTNLEPGELVHTIADAHIYLNHIEQVKEQLSRKPRPLPQLKIRPKKSIDEYWFDDFELIGYNPHPPIKGAVSV